MLWKVKGILKNGYFRNFKTYDNLELQQVFPQVLRTLARGGGSSKFDGGGGELESISQYMGGAWGGALNAIEKYLLRSS